MVVLAIIIVLEIVGVILAFVYQAQVSQLFLSIVYHCIIVCPVRLSRQSEMTLGVKS